MAVAAHDRRARVRGHVGLGSVVVGFECPLTHAENWARQRAGETGLPSSGFIDHYLTG